MSFELLLAAFDDAGCAAAAARAVHRLGVPWSQITRHPPRRPRPDAPAVDGGLWCRLFGRDGEARRIRFYQDALGDGAGAVLGVRVVFDEVDRVRNLLDCFGPLEVADPPPPPSSALGSASVHRLPAAAGAGTG